MIDGGFFLYCHIMSVLFQRPLSVTVFRDHFFLLSCVHYHMNNSYSCVSPIFQHCAEFYTSVSCALGVLYASVSMLFGPVVEIAGTVTLRTMAVL